MNKIKSALEVTALLETKLKELNASIVAIQSRRREERIATILSADSGTCERWFRLDDGLRGEEQLIADDIESVEISIKTYKEQAHVERALDLIDS